MDTATPFFSGDFDRCAQCVNEYDSCSVCVCCGVCLYWSSVVITQAATVTDAWAPSASRCLTCLRALLSTARLVYFVSLAVVH